MEILEPIFIDRTHYLSIDPYENEYRSDVFPAGDPEPSGAESEHLLNVRSEPLGAVKPAHGGRLDEHDEQDRVSRSVNIEQVNHVHAALPK